MEAAKIRLYKTHLRLSLGILFLQLFFMQGSLHAQQKEVYVRIAKIQVDAARLDEYKAALKAGIEAAIQKEPGVLTLYAVAEKDHPTHITVFEIYADQEAYQAHIETPHFKRYKAVTKDMVQSLELTDNLPIALGSKGRP